MSDLNNDFDKLAEKINAKLKEAAAALREVNDLSDQAGLPGLIYSQWIRDDLTFQNRLQAIADLLKEANVLDYSFGEDISDAGWSTSSSYC